MIPQTLLPVFVAAALLPAAVAAPQAELAVQGVVIDEIVAHVNSEIILKSDIARQQEALRQELMDQRRPPAEIASAVEASAPDLLRNLIDESLLTQKAAEYGLGADANLQVLRTMDRIRQQNGFDTIEDLDAAIFSQGDSPEYLRERIRNDYLSDLVISREVRSRINITTEELREYYDTHLEEFDKPSGISIAEIVKFTGGLSPAQRDIVQAEMEQILARLRDGEDFFEIASTESEAGTAINGGQQDYIEDGLLGPEYEAAVAPLARNGISGVFEVADQAFVIIRLLERHTGGILSFGLARPLLEQAILREKEEPRIREYLARLRSESFVEIRAGYVDTGASEGEEGEAGEDVEGFDGAPAAEAPDNDAVD